MHTQLAEPTVVIWTLDLALLRMGIQTFVSGGTIPVLCKPPTLRHSPEVILVQELARITLFTEAAQPMLANGSQAFSVPGMGWELLRRLEVLR